MLSKKDEKDILLPPGYRVAKAGGENGRYNGLGFHWRSHVHELRNTWLAGKRICEKQ